MTQLRSIDVTDEERKAAKEIIKSFEEFVRKLKGARNRDKEVVNIIKENQSANPEDLYGIRHLLRRFQQEVRKRYSEIIYDFSGIKNEQDNTIQKGYLHSFKKLEKDTTIRQIKTSIQDAMQQLSETIEEFMEAFEHFGSPDQINEIIKSSDNADKVVESLENVIEKQLKSYLEKNVIKKAHYNTERKQIMKRARLIKLLEG